MISYGQIWTRRRGERGKKGKGLHFKLLGKQCGHKKVKTKKAKGKKKKGGGKEILMIPQKRLSISWVDLLLGVWSPDDH